MKLDIDLNKLSMDELETVVRLAKKSEGATVYDDSEKEPELWQPKPIQKQDVNIKFVAKKSVRTWTPEMVQDFEKIFDSTKRFKVLMKRIARFTKKHRLTLQAGKSRAYNGGYMKEWHKKNDAGYHDAEKSKGMIRHRPIVPISPQEVVLRSAIIKENDIPDIMHCVDGFKSILKSIIKNVIDHDTLSLKYEVEGFAIGIQNVSEWSQFYQDFMVKSKEIADYYGVENKFRLVGLPQGRIQYG